MKEGKAFIKLFQTPGNSYLYDVNKNAIITIPEAVYNLLKEKQAEDKTINDLDSINGDDTIKLLIDKGFLSSKRVSEIVHPADKLLPDYLNKKVYMITLQVTQQCNFRCEYCVYSGVYENRGHSNKRMSLEMAKKGIDFLIEHSRDCKTISIGFYGGEPLMEFKLVKECILYAEEKALGKKIIFNMTTNGSLLNEENIAFFVEHDVHVMISLDGPQEIHDKSRSFASNNCGTFESVMKNLEMMKNKFPAFFEKNILLSVVINPENNYSCVNNFFLNYDTVKDSMINASFVSDTYRKERVKASNDFYENYNYELFKVYLSKLGKISDKSISKVANRAYEELGKDYKNLITVNKLPDKAHHGGPCIPGVTRLFMNVEGKFFPCERVSETSDMMVIGDIDNGFDIEKARKILNVGKLNESKCKNCWAFRFCSLCAAFADNSKELSSDIKNSKCGDVRNSVEETFKNICTLREFGHNFGV